jgi:N-acetylglucosaminyldiphosphoundecaprenol N-acetyl-beta-D-mannosaminyltransferase
MRHPDPNFGYPSLSFAEHERMLSRLQNHKAGKNFMRKGAFVLDTHIDALGWDEVVSRIASWASQHQSRYVTLCNVHSVVTASQCESFNKVINQADLALPDGAPVAWSLRREGFPQQQRINGPDLTWRYLAVAEKIGQSVFFYGSTDDTLAKLQARIKKQFPKLRIAGMVSPPYRELSAEEDQAYVDQINKSGANVVFVGLGCPKQEAWMAAHRGRIQAVMLGVGAAFDYHAGTVKRAPVWMQKCGLEWLHRLASEPRRLFKRYTQTNTIFIYRTAKSMLFGSGPHKQNSAL